MFLKFVLIALVYLQGIFSKQCENQDIGVEITPCDSNERKSKYKIST